MRTATGSQVSTPRQLGRPSGPAGLRLYWSSARITGLVVSLVKHLAIIAVSALMLVPALWMLSTSLKLAGAEFSYPPEWIPNPIVPGNYVQALTALPFHLFFRNTALITISNVFAATITASMVGFGFARLRFPGRDFLFVVLLSTMMLPGIITIIPRFVLFRTLGWVDTLLPLIVPEYFGGGPFFIFLVRQFFATLPYDLDEAARVDGASNWRIWWQIAVPLSQPVLAAVAVFTFVGSWNDFFAPLIYLNSTENFTLALGLNLFRGMNSTAWNLLMAAGMAMSLPMIVVFFFAQRYFMHGIVMTGMGGR